MFERFTERARQVVVLAQDEARALGHDYIGSEHLLLGLLREEAGLGARTLAELGVTLDAARGRLRELVGEGESGTAGQIPFTPDGKKALELSLRESQALGHDYIGTEHILLGLVRLGDGTGVRVLDDLGVRQEDVRGQVVRLLGGASAVSAGAVTVGASRPSWSPRFAGRHSPVSLVVAGWLLFALALGVGILVGWGIWG